VVPPPNKPGQKSGPRHNTAWVVGFEFVAAIAGFAILGFFIDMWRGTEPFWTLLLTALGFIGGTYNMFKEVRKLQAQSKGGFRQARKDSDGDVDARAATPEVAATRGRPRPTGRVNLFASEEISEEDLEDIEIDWPESERDEVEEKLRQIKRDPPEDSSP